MHWFLLRPILDLHGADRWTDKLLHVAVPLLAVIGWVAFGPRDRVRRSDLLPSLAFPVLWLAYTLVRGAVTGFYPYPFVDAAGLGLACGSRSTASASRRCSSRCRGWRWSSTGGRPRRTT